MQLIDGPYLVASLHSLQHVIHGMVQGLTYEFKVSSPFALVFLLQRDVYYNYYLSKKYWYSLHGEVAVE